MLLTKSIEIILKGKNIGYYSKLLNKKYKKNDIITIDVQQMPKNGYYRVDVSCDICNNINNVSLTSYNNSLEYGFYSCGKCKHIKRKMTNKEKYGDETFNNLDKRKNTKIEKYGDETFNNRNKSIETCKEKYGVDNVSQLDSVKLLKIKTTQKNYGVDNPFQSEEIKMHNKETHIENLGVDHPSKSEKIKQQKIDTCLENFGVEYPTQSSQTIQKIRESIFEKHGVDWYTKTDEYKESVKDSNNEKYGVDWYMGSKDFKEKSLISMNEKYGVDHPTKNIDIFHKQQKNGFKAKEYNELFYRGTYELDFIKFCELNSIMIENGPSIQFKMYNKSKIYHSDFYISKHNLIIEIKSEYYYNLYNELNQIKMKESISQGYNFIFIIDKKYDDLLKIIN